jgi:hypothetical protein
MPMDDMIATRTRREIWQFDIFNGNVCEQLLQMWHNVRIQATRIFTCECNTQAQQATSKRFADAMNRRSLNTPADQKNREQNPESVAEAE